MWKSANVSVRGSAHRVNGLPCQDSSRIQILGKEREIVICAVSDGAGSAKFAERGSQIIAEEAIAYFADQLRDHPEPAKSIAEYDRSDAETLIEHQQKKLSYIAAQENSEITDFSAT